MKQNTRNTNTQVHVLIYSNKDYARELEQNLLLFVSGIQKISIATKPFDAVDIILNEKPEILFYDSDYKDFAGPELLESIPKSIPLKVVFVSANESLAFFALKHHAFDYLLKPVTPPVLRATLLDCMAFLESGSQIKFPIHKDFLTINGHEKFMIIKFDDILYLRATGSYTHFRLTSNLSSISSKSLQTFESQLPKHQFIRPHRSFIFNLHNICEIDKTIGNGHILFTNNEKLELTREMKNNLIDIIDGIPVIKKHNKKAL